MMAHVDKALVDDASESQAGLAAAGQAAAGLIAACPPPEAPASTSPAYAIGTAHAASWTSVSPWARIALSSARQHVRCSHAPGLESQPCTLRALLEAPPSDAPCLIAAHTPAASPTTFGQLLRFVSPGGGGDLGGLGVQPMDVVAYRCRHL